MEIGKAMGATVIAAASSAEKLAVAKAAGADHLINYSESSLKEEVKKLTGGQGAVEPGRDAGGLKPLRELFADFVAARAAEGQVDDRFAAFMVEQGGLLLDRAIEESERAALAEEGAA